jgi:metal-responsive CopG/Arc/MetJ family transcriptional regulator
VSRAKIAITLDEDTLSVVDRLVSEHRFPNRSQAIQQALDEKLARLSHSRLAQECAKLDPASERALAEKGTNGEPAAWPEY